MLHQGVRGRSGCPIERFFSISSLRSTILMRKVTQGAVALLIRLYRKIEELCSREKKALQFCEKSIRLFHPRQVAAPFENH